MGKEPFGFNYEFTLKEILYLTFNNKKCPTCNVKMDEEKTFYLGDAMNRVIKGNSKCYIYLYHCPVCKKQYTLSELANKK